MNTSLKSVAVFLLMATLLASVSRADDLDEDGIDDAVEQMLIDMYRPVLHYDPDENVRPASMEWYVRHSELIWQTQIQGFPLDIVVVSNSQLNDPGDDDSPLRLLFEATEDVPSSMTFRSLSEPSLRINVFDDFHSGPAPVQPIGMYAHVAPLAQALQYSNGPTIPPLPFNADDFLLLQYWQFFPFNDFQFELDIGNHEGDWMWIDVFVERTCPYPVRYVVYHHHGDSECAPMVLGAGFNPLPPPSSPHPLPCSPNNMVPQLDCFLEAGAHEWWPYGGNGGECEFCVPCVLFAPCCAIDCCPDNRPHRGTLLSMRSENVLNLGERFAPMPEIEAQLVMLFNGLWGHDHGIPNGPSGGPLHQESPGYPFCPLMVGHVDPAADAWSGAGLGSRYHPFTTLSEAIDGATRVETGGRLLIAPDHYPGGLALTRPMRLEREGSTGKVVLGQ